MASEETGPGPPPSAGGAGMRPRLGAPLHGVSGVEDPAEDTVGGGAEGDREVEEPVEDLGPPGRRGTVGRC